MNDAEVQNPPPFQRPGQIEKKTKARDVNSEK